MIRTSLIAALALTGSAFAQETQQANLAGTTWTLDAIGGAPATPGRNGAYPRLAFGAETVSVFLGCNSSSGSYATDGYAALSVQRQATSRMHCQEEIMRAERAFGAALRNVSHFAIKGDRLELFDARYGRLATLRQSDVGQRK